MRTSDEQLFATTLISRQGCMRWPASSEYVYLCTTFPGYDVIVLRSSIPECCWIHTIDTLARAPLYFH